MRLLNAHTLVIKDIYEDIPPYAILSHTWETEEATFRDFQEGNASSLKGYKKIVGCCKRAVADGLEFVWIDTCCIDKHSSSELSEAINSMFRWYRDAAVCYAYLSDVQKKDEAITTGLNFSGSRWFTRGWTLQELIAPSVVVFFASDWQQIGTRDSLAELIAARTTIHADFFATGNLSEYSIAQKFSWAAKRSTTRIEDEAYCLLGLFGVNMPLLYGEGTQAFIRLQEELIRHSDDHSIFAWSSPRVDDADRYYGLTSHTKLGLLAPSPALFQRSGHIVHLVQDTKSPPYTNTNKGIQIRLPMIENEANYTVPFVPLSTDPPTKRYGERPEVPLMTLTPAGTLALLNCCTTKNVDVRLAIILEKDASGALYDRTNHATGLIEVPVADVSRHSVANDILIRAIAATSEKSLWRNPALDPDMVIVRPVTNHASGITFSGMNESAFKGLHEKIECKPQPNGNVILFLPKNVLDEHLDLYFEDLAGGPFVVVFSMVGSGPNRKLQASLKMQNDVLGRQHPPLVFYDREGGPPRILKTPDGRAVTFSLRETTLELEMKQLAHAKVVDVALPELLSEMRRTVIRASMQMQRTAQPVFPEGHRGTMAPRNKVSSTSSRLRPPASS